MKKVKVDTEKWEELPQEALQVMNQFFDEVVTGIYEKTMPLAYEKVLEQYEELVDDILHEANRVDWESPTEKAFLFKRLLQVGSYEDLYKECELLKEMEIGERTSMYADFKVQNHVDEIKEAQREEIEAIFYDEILENWLERLINKLLKHSFFAVKTEEDEKSLRAFVEEYFECDFYGYLIDGDNLFADNQYEFTCLYQDIEDFPIHREIMEVEIHKQLQNLEQDMREYEEQKKLATTQMMNNPEILQSLKQQYRYKWLEKQLSDIQQVKLDIEKKIKKPKDVKAFIQAVSGYEKGTWMIGLENPYYAYIKTQNPMSNRSNIKEIIYQTYLEEYDFLGTLSDDMYDSFVQEFIWEDVLNLEESVEEWKTKPLDEWTFEESDKSVVSDMKRIRNELYALYDVLMKREQRWLHDVLGPSVFETFKKNNPVSIVIHAGETNTGKTYSSLEALKKADTGLYLAPLRLLALEIYETFNRDGVPCSLKTGEEEKRVEGAEHTSSTVEMCRLDKDYDVVVIDECQMVHDEDRGSAWVRAILGVQAKELHLITAPEGLDILLKILEGKQVTVEQHERKTTLEVMNQQIGLKQVQKGDAIITFSRLNVLKTAKQLEAKGFKTAIIYGSMPPSVRQKQVTYFHEGKLDVVVATDAIGMGMNLPVKRVIFAETRKFDGKNVRKLKTSELRQIGGRAGRYGMYEKGYVGFMENAKETIKDFSRPSAIIKEIVISPTFELFERFYHAFELECEVKAFKSFIHYWRTYQPRETFVKVNPMAPQLQLAGQLESYVDKGLLSLSEVWRFVHIPCSPDVGELTKVWRENIRHYVKGERYELEIESLVSVNELEALEMAYKKIDVHLAFLEEGNVHFSYYEPLKNEIAEKIFDILVHRIEKLTKKCKHCKNRLPLTYEHPMCQSCFNKKYKRRDHYEDRWW